MPFLFVRSGRWLLMRYPAVRWVSPSSPLPSNLLVVLANSRPAPSVASASTWVSPPPSPPANFSRGAQCTFGEVMRPFGSTASHISPLMLPVINYILFVWWVLAGVCECACVCMCVRADVCVCVRVCACACVFAFVCMCVFAYVCVRACLRSWVCKCVHACVCFLRSCVCVRACVCV